MDLSGVDGFDWDSGNSSKNEESHGVHWTEAEEVFFNEPLIVVPDGKHSEDEKRSHAFGVTNTGRRLLIVFTLRSEGAKIRVISARDMSRKERTFYEQQAQ